MVFPEHVTARAAKAARAARVVKVARAAREYARGIPGRVAMMAAAAALAVGVLFPGGAWADPAKGEKVFRKCKACHVVEGDAKKIGPTLENVIGRAAGAVEGFKYSTAMRQAGEDGLIWTEEEIGAYLAMPRKYLKGNKMSFAGLRKQEDIDNVIAYLRQFTTGQ